MASPVPIAKFSYSLPMAGAIAAMLSAVALGVCAALTGLPSWMPLNATSHVWHGPAAADVTAITWSHTAFGTAIHIASAFFWAAVAIVLFRVMGNTRTGAAWMVGLGTAALAGVIDYGLMPSRLTPGWELVLPNAGVVAGFVALGVGIAIGLGLTQRRHADMAAAGFDQPAASPSAASPSAISPSTDPAAPTPELERMRRPSFNELDQRQQRIDPAGMVTADMNWRDDGNRKQPGGSDRPKRDESDQH